MNPRLFLQWFLKVAIGLPLIAGIIAALLFFVPPFGFLIGSIFIIITGDAGRDVLWALIGVDLVLGAFVGFVAGTTGEDSDV